MKKILQSVVVRALSYLAMGLLFIVYSHQVSNWLVVVSGAFFALTGVIVLLNHWWKRKERPSLLYPVTALGAVCFGLVLILFSPLFLTALRTCVAVFLFGVGLVQLYSLWRVIRAGAKLSFAYSLVPLSGAGAAVFVFLYRHFTLEDPLAFQLLGAALMVYAFFEVVLAVHFRKVARGQLIAAGKPAAAAVTTAKAQEKGAGDGAADQGAGGKEKKTEDMTAQKAVTAGENDAKGPQN